MSTDSGEHINPRLAGLIDEELTRKAAEFEGARVQRQAIADAERARRNRRVQLQFWFLFGFLVVAIGVLAYRTEVNDQNLRQAQLEGCERRAQQAEVANEGRTTLINLVIATPTNQNLSVEEKAITLKRLQEGLILPIEDCSGYQTD
jgi:hypothetical protein